MKILILSDIHGNLHALEAVLKHTPHDLVICCGDLVVGCPFPDPCIEALENAGARVCTGNHDDVIAHDRQASSQLQESHAHLAPLLERLTDSTRRYIGESGKAYLKNLPREQLFQVEGTTFYMNHTAPGLPLHHYILPDTPEQERIEPYNGIPADILITGHTHMPYVKQVGHRVIVNPGSIGEPRDGDPRAGFAVFDTRTGRVELNRLAYDVSETIRVLEETDCPEFYLHCLKSGSLPQGPPAC